MKFEDKYRIRVKESRKYKTFIKNIPKTIRSLSHDIVTIHNGYKRHLN